ncbi:TonB-dependent receptor [Achromobacter xylosoxidans]|uniref:TonB-dependent receptor n=1 Tax=Alcaligenes xylosoxydans xylosoxydans TaxID=85698 RepID=UPI001F132A96|nr:TonB-dependent receptor [Achromobacter xylosoxidans]
MTIPFRPVPIVSSCRRAWPMVLLALAGVAADGMVAGAARAQTPPAGVAARHQYDIAPGPLDQALARYGRIAGVNLSYDAALVAGAHSAGLSGSHDDEQALRLLLAGSGIEAVARPGGYALRRATQPGVVTLPATTVRASSMALAQELPPAFAGGQVARGSRLGMLGYGDVFDTPFATKSFTSELIRNQGARTMNDIVANDPSIRTSLSATSPLDQSSIRGFLTNSDAYLFDGLEGLFAYSNIPIQHYERVEILKGPAAALIGGSGYGSTVGGTFNLVPKRAIDTPVRVVSAYATDKALFGTHLDMGERLGENRQWGIRVNATAENGKRYDDARRRLDAMQVALDYRGANVRATLDAGYTRRRSTPMFNHWLLAPGASVPSVPDPDIHPKPSWEVLDVRQRFGVVGGEWDFTPGWTAYARYGKLKESAPTRYYIDQTTIDGEGRYRYASATSMLWDQVNEVGDLGVRGEARIGPTSHRLAFSMVRQRQQLRNLREVSRRLATPVVGTIYEQVDVPDPFADGAPHVPGVDSPAQYLNSVAAADTIGLFQDRLLVTVAARHQSLKKGSYDESRVVPTYAALYKLGGGLSVYGNYAEALTRGDTAPAGARNASAQLAPYISRQHEIGLKWDRGEYGLTLAYFDIRKTSAFLDADNVFKAAGRQRNRGVELEAFGEVAPGTRVLGGVAWIEAKMLKTANGVNDGHRAIGVPQLNVNLGVEHDLAAVPGLTLTGRMIHTGAAYVDLANTQRIGSWRRFDVGARYATRVAGYDVTFLASVNNVLNDHYWTISGCNFISSAAPRTWMLSSTVAF